ncbi:hypothetical protein KUTeg_005839 [Tegillarca granosa]|uniref:Uncharacterized protein n=1 Tax=Tegillarca granosa TaxID=220873 RepID=A0ABQ9FH17_TEGGR|nr:hypothetical protein KUTeg_005913 [Tegillarca granosa]KAJ8316612.1 hypothetical protein KUTeg_005839 [Tegillarca granosa]
MTKDLFENEQIMPIILSQHPLGKVAKVEDIMEATIFLLSEDAAMITGSTLAVDGGFLQMMSFDFLVIQPYESM